MVWPEITFGFCAVICFLAWLNWRICLWFLLCAGVHELGHLLAMRLCRVRLRGMTLSASGAVIDGAFPNYALEFWCALAGPMIGILLGIGLLFVLPVPAIISLLLSAINLLPLYPLDGGRMLRALLLRRFAPELVARWLCIVRFVTCGILMLLACWAAAKLQMGLWPIFAALLLLTRAGSRD